MLISRVFGKWTQKSPALHDHLVGLRTLAVLYRNKYTIFIRASIVEITDKFQEQKQSLYYYKKL